MGLALCGLATLVAIPVLFFGRGSSVEIDASTAMGGVGLTPASADEAELTTTEPPATASSLLETVDRNSLLDGGADPAAALQLQQSEDPGTSTTIVLPSQSNSPTGLPSSSGSTASPLVAADSGESARETAEARSATDPSPSSTTPTTGAPSTAAPTTAAPTTAAPTTAAPTTAPPATVAPTTAPPATEPPVEAETAPAEAEPAPEVEADTSGPSAADWEALRQCEAFGSYTIQSANGLYHGAYQFGVGTWNAIASSVGRTDLVGVLPSDASPADQDAMALALWNQSGWSPWPHCGRGLG